MKYIRQNLWALARQGKARQSGIPSIRCDAVPGPQTRPDLSYRISKIRSTFGNACVRNLRECNRIVEFAISTSTRGIYLSPELSWADAVVVTICDASCCQEQEQVDGTTQNAKSQQGCITEQGRESEEFCRSTLMAEAFAPPNAVEHGLRTRTVFVDMRGQLNIRQWEENSFCSNGACLVYGLWKYFCSFVFPNTKQFDNKRLAIDLSAPKQIIWDNRDDCDDEFDGSKGDYFRWIDTSAMLSDCLTKTLTSYQFIWADEYMYL